MIEVKRENLQKAIARNMKARMLVQPSSIYRQYKVTNKETGARYVVNFFIRKSDGKRFGHCDCLGGQKNLACKHLSAAAALHVAIARMRRATAAV